MKNGQLHSFRERIMATRTFQELSPVAQKIMLTRNNLSHINNGYQVAKNLGFKKWDKEYGHSTRNKLIVKELLDNE